LGDGLNFFTNAVDKTPATKDSYQDVDVSGDGVPEGASGAIFEIRISTSSTYLTCSLRANGSSWSPANPNLTLLHVGGYAFIPLDANRVCEASVSAGVELWLIGYTGSDVVYLIDPPEVGAGTGGWADIEMSGTIPSGATGVICLLTHTRNAYNDFGGIRCNGSTDTFPYCVFSVPWRDLKWQYCGLDTNRVFEMQRSIDQIDCYVYAYTKGEITFYTNGVEKSHTQANTWEDVDITNETDANADGVLLMVKHNEAWNKYEAHVRKNGSSDNRTTGSELCYSESVGTSGCCGMAIGLDSGQVYEAYMGHASQIDVYVIGYNAPAGATLQTVADSLALSESVLRNKSLLPVSDSVGLADSLYGNKILLLSDSASLSEFVTVIMGAIVKYVTDSVNIVDLAYALKTLKTSDSLTLVDAASTPSRVLKALDAIGATDNAVVNKVLQITETVSLAEIVEVGVGSVKKTRLFLILGDLAVQLTGE
jgi:hypothetical protein